MLKSWRPREMAVFATGRQPSGCYNHDDGHEAAIGYVVDQKLRGCMHRGNVRNAGKENVTGAGSGDAGGRGYGTLDEITRIVERTWRWVAMQCSAVVGWVLYDNAWNGLGPRLGNVKGDAKAMSSFMMLC